MRTRKTTVTAPRHSGSQGPSLRSLMSPEMYNDLSQLMTSIYADIARFKNGKSVSPTLLPSIISNALIFLDFKAKLRNKDSLEVIRLDSVIQMLHAKKEKYNTITLEEYPVLIELIETHVKLNESPSIAPTSILTHRHSESSKKPITPASSRNPVRHRAFTTMAASGKKPLNEGLSISPAPILTHRHSESSKKPIIPASSRNPVRHRAFTTMAASPKKPPMDFSIPSEMQHDLSELMDLIYSEIAKFKNNKYDSKHLAEIIGYALVFLNFKAGLSNKNNEESNVLNSVIESLYSKKEKYNTITIEEYPVLIELIESHVKLPPLPKKSLTAPAPAESPSPSAQRETKLKTKAHKAWLKGIKTQLEKQAEGFSLPEGADKNIGKKEQAEEDREDKLYDKERLKPVIVKISATLDDQASYKYRSTFSEERHHVVDEKMEKFLGKITIKLKNIEEDAKKYQEELKTLSEIKNQNSDSKNDENYFKKIDNFLTYLETSIDQFYIEIKELWDSLPEEAYEVREAIADLAARYDQIFFDDADQLPHTKIFNAKKYLALIATLGKKHEVSSFFQTFRKDKFGIGNTKKLTAPRNKEIHLSTAERTCYPTPNRIFRYSDIVLGKLTGFQENIRRVKESHAKQIPYETATITDVAPIEDGELNLSRIEYETAVWDEPASINVPAAITPPPLPTSRPKPRRPKTPIPTASAHPAAAPAPAEKKDQTPIIIKEIFSTEASFKKGISDLIGFLEVEKKNDKFKQTWRGYRGETIEEFIQQLKILHYGIPALNEFPKSSLEFFKNLHESTINLEWAEYLDTFKKLIISYHHYEKQIEEIRIKPSTDPSKPTPQPSSWHIMPVQRPPRYILLLKELLKNQAPSSEEAELIDSTLSFLTTYTNKINEAVRVTEIEDGVQALKAKTVDRYVFPWERKHISTQAINLIGQAIQYLQVLSDKTRSEIERLKEEKSSLGESEKLEALLKSYKDLETLLGSHKQTLENGQSVQYSEVIDVIKFILSYGSGKQPLQTKLTEPNLPAESPSREATAAIVQSTPVRSPTPPKAPKAFWEEKARTRQSFSTPTRTIAIGRFAMKSVYERRPEKRQKKNLTTVTSPTMTL